MYATHTPRRIGVTSRLFKAMPELVDLLRELHPQAEVRVRSGDAAASQEELVRFLAGSDAAVIGLERFDAATLDRLPELRVIACCSAGIDHLDAVALAQRGIRIGWTPGVNSVAVAELTVALMIDLLRGVSRSNRRLRAGRWVRSTPGRLLHGRTVGIHGCGNIGRRLVQLLQPFEVEILACDLVDQPDFYERYGVEAVDARELRRRSEILTLHLPRNPSTLGLYDADTLAELRPGSLFLNLARGGLVDEASLRGALVSGRIAGAALDVFAVEPPEDLRLARLPNVVAVPHIGALTHESWEAMGRAGIRGLSENQVPRPGVYPFDS